MKTEDIARVAHEALRAYEQTQGDHGIEAWDQFPGKVATIREVDHLAAHPTATAADVFNVNKPQDEPELHEQPTKKQRAVHIFVEVARQLLPLLINIAAAKAKG